MTTRTAGRFLRGGLTTVVVGVALLVALSCSATASNTATSPSAPSSTTAASNEAAGGQDPSSPGRDSAPTSCADQFQYGLCLLPAPKGFEATMAHWFADKPDPDDTNGHLVLYGKGQPITGMSFNKSAYPGVETGTYELNVSWSNDPGDPCADIASATLSPQDVRSRETISFRGDDTAQFCTGSESAKGQQVAATATDTIVVGWREEGRRWVASVQTLPNEDLDKHTRTSADLYPRSELLDTVAKWTETTWCTVTEPTVSVERCADGAQRRVPDATTTTTGKKFTGVAPAIN